MSDETFDLNEFMKPPEQPVVQVAELDVQKVVVEELAAEKAELHENISSLEEKIASLKAQLDDANKTIDSKNADLSRKDDEIAEKNKALEDAKGVISAKDAEISGLSQRLADASLKIAELDAKINEKLIAELDQQERNPNALALLDREVELPDRFPGETRDHVLEVVKEARDEAEKAGRRRRAQLLEGVLVANEPNGGLAKKRVALEKFFKDNAYVMNGTVIAELERCGIQYKDGDQYLLPKEILLRTY